MEPISVSTIVIICICVFFTGIAKGGLAGASSVIVPVLALTLGGKDSVGFLFPISLGASFISALRNREDVNWQALAKVLPFALAGICLGAFLGEIADEKQFFILLAIVIIIGCILSIMQHYNHTLFKDNHGIFVIIFGLLSGFAAMVGNVTGPLISTLFILQRFPKKQFVTTYVWFCFITDVLKIPFHVFYWHTITSQTLIRDFYYIPLMIFGVFCGNWLINKLPDNLYKTIILILSCISAIVLLFA